MNRLLDFSSWQGAIFTLLSLVLVSLVVVGIRLLVMQTVQQRRERANRQINERLKTLIAAYKTLGGSFTGVLTVDPAHRRDLRQAQRSLDDAGAEPPGAERRRVTRDAVEAALSDVILLGTQEQVRLAVQAANDMVAGRNVETAALVVSLRNFIRDVLDLEVVAADLAIPKQGPLRPAVGGPRGGRGDRAGGAGGRAGGGGGQGGGEGAIGMGGAAGPRDSAGGSAPSAPP